MPACASLSRSTPKKDLLEIAGEGSWTWSDTPPWDSRPTAENLWAAFTAAEWASQQKLDWSHRERVFELLKKKDAEVARRGGLEGLVRP